MKRSLQNTGAVASAKPEQSALNALKQSDLTGLLQQAEQRAALNRELRRNLSPALAKQCRLCAVDGNTLVFSASNPVWKNKLRLHSREILALASAAGLAAQALKITVDLSFQLEPDQ